VDSADDAANKAKELGGKVEKEAFDVMDVGRMAVLSDPTGGAFSIWQSKKHTGMDIEPGQIGGLCWNELLTNNVDLAGKFYSELFGWKIDSQDMGGFQYHVFMSGEKPAAGMMGMAGEQLANVPPHWAVYFTVEDCDGTVAKATAAGGVLVVPRQDIENVGRFATIRDPQGAHFAVLQPAPMPEK
jgi:predicted enzyme related to lactoylglutathione lyase